MTIRIYNTLTREKEVFIPIRPNHVTFYVCGPTVYNYIHIGNARSSVAFDTVRRYLEYRGYHVEYVSNFTDVDDKIIKAANSEGMNPIDLADKYIQAFKEDTQAIHIREAKLHPRVTDHIEEIIQFIQVLIDKEHAYVSQGDVYFRTDSFEDYGKLSRKSLQELKIGASERTRDEETERKESPLDFALWKTNRNPDEIAWDSPWGPGRPGWHIECSVMATQHLGPTIDIHAGGQDLEFPHHENEIAQSECHFDQKFANYWMHNGFVTIGVDEEKMSKSLGNFVLLRDLLDQVHPDIIRYLLATVHYRRPLKFDQEAIKDASHNIERIKEALRRLAYRQENAQEGLSDDNQWLGDLEKFEEDFIEAMDDDFNAANGITVVFALIRLINQYLEKEAVSLKVLNEMKQVLSRLLSIFGLEFENDEAINHRVQALIDERNQARAAKDFVKADAIRDQLKEEGIILNDTPQGTTWKRGVD